MPRLRQQLQSMGVKLKASELIGLLAELMKEHGDLPVYSLSGGRPTAPTVKVETLNWNTEAIQRGIADRPVVTVI